MVAAANLVEVAALVGDTARATMLNALMGGRSLTATELAYYANVSRSTASGHLSKLVAARLLNVTRKRRFSYYRIASPLVATMLESIKVVAAIEVPARRQPRSTNDEALRFARTCYDHLAGTVAVALTDALIARGHVVLSDDGGEVTPQGARIPRVLRHRPYAAASRPTPVLPAMPRLERAPLSSQGPARRGPALPLPRSRLVRARTRQPGAAVDACRKDRSRRCVRCRA